ncbi:tRNA (adenosine(37)-N6)-dimethylallyltransferase MiaA [uncultured Helicobacter sp.]|uniref:tRNA (adenosine(37)-N6)-dimethylallyltransferase MiaA n=1 Tax=uncultured Helicobacter sp. TaxID=175537 RepID=UPI00374F3F03
MQIFALIGASGSGKSALGIELATRYDGEIFSLDSLSIYRYITIASAKPSPQDLAKVRHYGIDELDPHQPCNVMTFWQSLESALTQAKSKGKKTFFIVGGSSFYLKSMIEGLSPMPQLTQETSHTIHNHIASIPKPYEFLSHIDSLYAQTLQPTDTYRIHKALEIYFATDTIPSVYFVTNPKQKFLALENIPILVLDMPRDILRERINIRTHAMISQGLLDEVRFLRDNYPAHSQSFKAIGIKESLEFLATNNSDTKILHTLISTHTAQLAKRQSTFNRTQFRNALFLDSHQIHAYIASHMQ